MPAKSIDFSFESIKSGDKKAFEAVFKEYYKPLVQYSYRIIRDQEEAEGIVQQIFLAIWEKRQSLDIQGPMENYLFRATKNRCINYVKLELPKKQKMDPVEAAEELKFVAEEENNQNQLSENIKIAIDTLPEKCKEIFLLSRYAGLTYAEIAEELNISIKTVENQITIALKKLRTELKNFIK